MCGLCGTLSFDAKPADRRMVEAMTAAIAHRGPDGMGIFLDGPLGLGHRRLAVIDLTEAGAQPMSSVDGRYTIVHNGEVYNFRELRKELESRGRRFRSLSDTEVVLQAWAEWGSNALDRFNGMFAFAIWDREERALWLARDRYGIKPLYIWRDDAGLLFGSEIKCMLAHGAVTAALDAEGLTEYLTFQNFFTERTLFKGVHVVPPATLLRIDADGATRSHVYWDYAYHTQTRHDEDRDYARELDSLFRQAVCRQLVSDVDIGVYLSGGVDSAAIASVASGELPGMRSFTVGFDLHSASGMELSMDERETAEQLAYHYGTEQYEMVLKAGDMERIMDRLVWHLEEPRVGQSYPNFYAAGLASRFGKVVLAGTGGDELFGGYPWRYYRAASSQSFDEYVDRYYDYWQRLLPGSTRREILRPIEGHTSHVDTRDIFRSVFQSHAGRMNRPEDFIKHSLYFEAKTFLHGLLIVEDKLSMAHGLETRVPFLDNDLVDFANGLPVTCMLARISETAPYDENAVGPKSRQFSERYNDGKLLLRQVISRYVPDSIARAPKQGFSAPDASWFRGESIEYVKRTLLDPRAAIFDFLDRSTVHRLVHEHLNGQANHRLLVWSFLYLERWCQLFLENSLGQTMKANATDIDTERRVSSGTPVIVAGV